MPTQLHCTHSRPHLVRRGRAILLCLLLAACTPADPLAFVPATAAPTTAATLPAEPTHAPANSAPPAPTEPATPVPSPTPQPRLILPADAAITPAEQATLQTLTALIANPPAEWGMTASMDAQPGRIKEGYITLTLFEKPADQSADPQPVGRIIVLDANATATIAIVDLAGAQAAGEALGLAITAVTVEEFTEEGARIVGVDANGQPVVKYDLNFNAWGPIAPPTPEPTATPDATEALRQSPWEVQYTTGASGELTAQYYNDKTQEVVAVSVPEVAGLQAVLWQAPNGESRAIYLDTTNQYGLAQHTEKFADTAVNYPVGYAGEFEPKIKVEMPSGELQRGGVVLLPEVTRKLTAEFRAKLLPGQLERGFWGMPFPLDTRGTTGRDEEVSLKKFQTFPFVEVPSGIKPLDVVTIPISDPGVEYTNGDGGNILQVLGINLEKAELISPGGWQLLLTVPPGANINSTIAKSFKEEKYQLGFPAATNIREKIDVPEPNKDHYFSVGVFNGQYWAGFNLTNTFLRTADGNMVFQATNN